MHQLYTKKTTNCKSIIDIFLRRFFGLLYYGDTKVDKSPQKPYTYLCRHLSCSYAMPLYQAKIIHHYKKISTFFFGYLVFLIALVIGFFVFQTTVFRSASIMVFEENDEFFMQKTKLITEFNKFMRQNIEGNDMTIHILQWDLESKDGFVKSVNNLINYQWFILPKYFYIYATIPTKPLSYFSWSDYDIDELEHILNTFVFTKRFTITKPFTRVLLPFSTDITTDFNLGCLFENKLSSKTCDKYLYNFLDSFFVYRLAQDYEWLQNVFDALATSSQKVLFCEGLSKYLLYANDYSNTIETLFAQCGQTYADNFKRITLFMEIQSTLDNQVFDSVSYRDPLLNTYKLLSYQQQLYQDFLINKADTYKISMYLWFVRDLLKKNTIDAFYKDEIYRYNNRYLALTLEKLAYHSTTFTQSFWSNNIASLLTTIHALNVWEPLLGFSWLVDSIQNSWLIISQTPTTWSTLTIDIPARIATKLKDLSYLTIETQSILDTTINIVWYLKFISPDTTENIKSHIILNYDNDIFTVQSLELQDKAGINDIIKNLLLIQNFSLGELYSYINKNLVFYEQENVPIRTSTDLCPNLSALKNTKVISCTNTEAILEKNAIRYQFTFENGWLENISISDKVLENNIKTSYSKIMGNTYLLIDMISLILNYQLPTNDREGTANAIFVFERIQHYLGITTNDIADKNGKIFVDITLWGINFIVQYTLSTNTLGPRYFKDIVSGTNPYMIQNLDLVLDDGYQNTIHTFVIDPLTAIKTIDVTARQNYNERLKNN